MKSRLPELYIKWKEWARTASKSEDGWESDFPEWGHLMAAAMEAMRNPPQSAQEMEALSACWAISSEDEELLEYASQNIDLCWTAIESLASSPLPDCRWQIYEIASIAGKKAEPLLRKALEDKEPYPLRRALLALARLKPEDGPAIALPFLDSKDEYIKAAAIELSNATPSSKAETGGGQDISVKEIYIPLLEEGTPCWRPARGVELANGVYRVFPIGEYAAEEEKWKYPPGSVVKCEKRSLQGVEAIVAVESIKTSSA